MRDLSIEAVLADPASLDGEPVERVAELVARCTTALTLLHARVATAGAEVERMLTAEQVAERIGMSRSWVTRYPDQLPPARSVGGRPRWLASEIDAWLLSRPLHGNEARQGRRVDSASTRAILDSIPGRRAAV